MKNNWYYHRFRILCDDFKKPQYWIDIFIIDTIFREILSKYNSILHYRFHRRCDNDEAGHQLSLLFYTNQKTSSQIDKFIKANKIYKLLENNDLLIKYVYEQSGESISSTSDPNWTGLIQDAWPLFIEGLSNMILGMIDELRNDKNIRNILDANTIYNKINDKLSESMMVWGRHVFFHHINAMFGNEYSLIKI